MTFRIYGNSIECCGANILLHVCIGMWQLEIMLRIAKLRTCNQFCVGR